MGVFLFRLGSRWISSIRHFLWSPFSLVGLFMVVMAVLAVFAAEPARAQCGASASSCKNCHEVNAEHPVNGSGKWHTAHAFGDFCSFCHSGDVQAVAKVDAHKGMVYPLADAKSSCQSCHPNDYTTKADGYAKILGVSLTSGGPAAPANTSNKASDNGATAECKPIAPPGEDHASGALVDFNRRYDVEALGLFDPSRTGNLIMAGAAGLLLLLGFALVWRFERLGDAFRRARAVPADDWRLEATRSQQTQQSKPAQKGEQKQ